MSHFLTAIQVNKIFHLENFEIPVSEDEKKHLLITGKNGSGKTSLLNALKEFLETMIRDKHLAFLGLKDQIRQQKDYIQHLREKSSKEAAIHQSEVSLKGQIDQYNSYFSKIHPSFSDIVEISKLIQSGDFILAIYEANRKTAMQVPRNPEKPNLKDIYGVGENKQQEFLKFLVDLKIQEALARNEKDEAFADEVRVWFENFTFLLCDIFDRTDVSLDFNYKDYSFTICLEDRRFGFNELSDGYSAIIDIVADLVLKMQPSEALSRVFKKEGIVLIDEVETHLHLELQKVILPFLTKVFPNIQFIVTTHSPFVLSSLKNAVAYDLEKRERLDDLSNYSYEALAEGYFRVTGDSTYLDSKLKRFKELLQLKQRDHAESRELQILNEELSKLDSNLAPEGIMAQYLQFKLQYSSLLK